MSKILKCRTCDKKLKGRQLKFCSIECKYKNNNVKYQGYARQQKKAYDKKLYLVEQKGGGCNHCGYKKNYAALHFHHIDASKKTFKLDSRSLANYSFDKINKEAEKCILLCANCHAELHNPRLNF